MYQIEHDLYRERAPLWWFWTLSYAGGEYMRGSALYSLAGQAVRRMYPTRDIPDRDVNYLWRFDGEKAERYDERLERAHFDRLAGAALDGIVAGVTQGCQDPELPEAMQPMLKDVDGRGTAWSEWRVNKAALVGMNGHCHVGADLPTAEMIESGTRVAGLPYLYLVPPLALPCWELDEDGNWILAVVRECVPVSGVKAQMQIRYRIWTRDTVRLIDGNGQALPFPDGSTEMENPFGRVPLETTYYAPDPLLSDSRFGRSWMEGPARKNQHHYNLGSWIDEIAFKVTFPTLAMPVPEGESQVAPEQKVAIGLGQALAYSGGGLPQWLNPPRESVDVLRDLRNEDVAAIRQAAGLSAPEGAGSREMPSGEALRQIRVHLGALLGSFGAQLSAGDVRDLKMAAEIASYRTDEIRAPYPSDYAAPDALTRLDEVERVYNLGLRDVPAAASALLESAFRVVLPEADSAVMKATSAQLETQRLAAEKAAQDSTPKENLNGAQLSSLLEIVKAVSAAEVPRDTGVGMLVMAFGITPDQADDLLGTAGKGEKPNGNDIRESIGIRDGRGSVRGQPQRSAVADRESSFQERISGMQPLSDMGEEVEPT